jgi:hypothetical protein
MKRPLPATDSHSRRSVLTALAAVPVASVPALAGVGDASEPDPIFALIDAARLALKAHEEALENCFDPAEVQALALAEAKFGDKPCDLEALYPPLKAAREKVDPLGRIQYDAEDAVLGAKPRTLAGLAAQLVFAAHFWEYDDPGNFLVPFLVNAARTIDAQLVSKIGFSEHVAECLDEV